MLAPKFFEVNGKWWCQSCDKVAGLVTGIGATQDDARKAWQEAYEKAKKWMVGK
jgi:hypothetical protein